MNVSCTVAKFLSSFPSSLPTSHFSPDTRATVICVPAWPMSTNTATLVGSPAFCWRRRRKEGGKKGGTSQRGQ